ncbi:MAG: hypothetical protein LBP79_07035 [Clostridiales bacterium]|jgi:hypothetical protein|nr:hypothetical protein [Clostridiales bacterium]
MPEIYSFLNSKDSICANIYLARAIDIDAAIVYGALIEKHDYCENNGEILADGFFFFSHAGLCATTSLSGVRQTRALNVLAENGLIAFETNGNKRFLTADDKNKDI